MDSPVLMEGDYDTFETNSELEHLPDWEQQGQDMGASDRFPSSSPQPLSPVPHAQPKPWFRPYPTPNWATPHPWPEPSPPPEGSGGGGDGSYFLLIVLGVILVIIGSACRYYFYKSLWDARNNNSNNSSRTGTVATTPLVRPSTNAESPARYGGTVERPPHAAAAPYGGQTNHVQNYNYQSNTGPQYAPSPSGPPPPILPSAPPAPSGPETKYVDDTYIASTFGGTKSCIHNSCVVCLDVEKSIVMEPCKHFCACYDCAHKLKECPLCRQKITGFAQYVPGVA